MGAVTSLFVRKVVAALDDPALAADLLRGLDLEPDGPPDVDRMISAEAYYATLERIARTIPDATGFPLRVGASMRCDDYGAFGLAWKTAPTLRGSFQRGERYGRLLTSVALYELRPVTGGALFLLHRDGDRRLGLRLSNEATLASILSIVRQVVTQPVAPRAVYLRHTGPQEPVSHTEYFGVPVTYDAPHDGFLFADDDLDRANRLGDPAISQYLTIQLDAEMSRRAPESGFAEVLMRRISDRLSEGAPRAGDMAREMGMSERTLRRRLADDGTSYQDMLARARQRLAEGLLARSEHGLAEIAFLTGFSEQSAFSRAFKGWTGDTPATYRARHRA